MWKSQVTTGARISYWGSVGSKGHLCCRGNNNDNTSDARFGMSDVRVSLQLSFPQTFNVTSGSFSFFFGRHHFILSFPISGAAPMCSNFVCQRVQQYSATIRVRTVWGSCIGFYFAHSFFFFSSEKQTKRNLFCVRSVSGEENKQQTAVDIIRVDAAENCSSSEALTVHCCVFGLAWMATVEPLLRNYIIINIITINCWIKEKAKCW